MSLVLDLLDKPKLCHLLHWYVSFKLPETRRETFKSMHCRYFCPCLFDRQFTDIMMNGSCFNSLTLHILSPHSRLCLKITDIMEGLCFNNLKLPFFIHPFPTLFQFWSLGQQMKSVLSSYKDQLTRWVSSLWWWYPKVWCSIL